MEDGLRVGTRPVLMTPSLQLAFELGMVIDLAIEDDPGILVAGRHRLSASGDVDNRQPAVRQAHRPLRPETLAVRTAMAEDVPHPTEPFQINRLIGIEVNDSGYAAHGFRRRQ